MNQQPKAARQEKRFYFAYGSNCNLNQMVHRCPMAATVGAVTLRNYALEFNHVASIRRKNGAEVKGVLWEITPECERNLDRYEGFPNFYTKKRVTVYTGDGEPVKAMVYIMTPANCRPAYPARTYYDGIWNGFLQNSIVTDTLEAALENTEHRIRAAMGGIKGGRKQEARSAW